MTKFLLVPWAVLVVFGAVADVVHGRTWWRIPTISLVGLIAGMAGAYLVERWRRRR